MSKQSQQSIQQSKPLQPGVIGFKKPMQFKTTSNATNNNTKKPTFSSVFGQEDDDEDKAPKLRKLPLLEENDESTPTKQDDENGSAESSRPGTALGDKDAMEVDESNQGEEEEDDPLDMFMTDVHSEVTKLMQQHVKKTSRLASNGDSVMADGGQVSDEERDKKDGNNDDDDSDIDENDIMALAAKRLAKKKDWIVVDHSKVDYEPFRKDFFIEPEELSNLSDEELDMLRSDLDGIKIRGKDCPKPVDKWSWMGLPPSVFEIIRRVLKYEKPSPIQSQAIPAIMSGRDVIGIAKTGSGKTIAFLLPMFRHIKDQRPLETNEGPIALIMTPTRELATQIYRECKHFAKVLGLRAVAAYGGSSISDQIADLKRGTEIIIGTPGRIIDLLTANNGRVTNLQRVTYLVLDEADRMFDMGFEPQVMKIMTNVRPDRQTVLFSATFPRQMEALARKVLTRPLEITVGGRSVVAKDIEQRVEIVPEEKKFLRLLEILGLSYEREDDPDSRILIFVDRQEAADNLLRDLFKRGYPCQSLHGGKDQMDRDSTISDFKSGVTNLLVATSVAARGLDVKQLKIVINYDCPNHMEDYVHRCGRTGRAGNKGTAYTFITPGQDKYAVDVVKALKASNTPVPDDVQSLADEFIAKVKSGSAQFHSSGFGGKGLDRLDKERDVIKKLQRKTYGADVEEDEEEDGAGKDTEGAEDVSSGPGAAATAIDETPSTIGSFKFEVKPIGTAQVASGASTESTEVSAKALQAAVATSTPASTLATIPGAQRARDMIAEINAKLQAQKAAAAAATTVTSSIASGTGGADASTPSLYGYEIEINDFPQKARWKVTNRDQIVRISDLTGAAITTRGSYFAPNKPPGPGERKLHLLVEGESQMIIDHAKNEIKRILMEATVQAMEAEMSAGGRYSVV